MITDQALFELATRHIERADMQPAGPLATSDRQTGALLLVAFELRRIANTLADFHKAALEERE